MAGNLKLRLGADPQKFPRYRSRLGDGGKLSDINPLAEIICPA